MLTDEIKRNFFKLYNRKDWLEYEMKDLMRIDNLFKTTEDLQFYIDSIYMFEDEVGMYRITLTKMLREAEDLQLYEYCQIIQDKLNSIESE